MDIFTATAHLPVQTLALGEVLVREGQAPAGLWVLVSGALEVIKAGVPVNTIRRAGAVVGEISVLLNAPYGATVRATEPCVLRHAADGPALLASHPDITRLVAVGLAERLNVVTTYLADLKHQYGDAPGLSMVAAVVQELSQHRVSVVRPGSARDPEPEY